MLIMLATVSSHWLPPSALSRERSRHHDGENYLSNSLMRSERDVDHCGPDDPVPPNRVNTSVQVWSYVLAIFTKLKLLISAVLMILIVVPVDTDHC